jgi:hypothetical protein
MEKYDIYKEFSSDKTIDELRFNLRFYKSRLELLNLEFDFFKHVLNANIYNSRTPNLFESLELFKKRIDEKMKFNSNLLLEIESQYTAVELKMECDELSCDDYFVRRNYELELDVVNFLTETAKLKSEMMEFLKSLII